MRGTGRTTRLVDEAIQNLFNNGRCIAFDHWPDRQADHCLFERIIKRLEFEHHKSKDDLVIDINRMTISLKDFRNE